MDINNDTIIENAYPSLIGSRKKIIDSLLKKIKSIHVNLKLAEEDLFLVIDEALTNAMEHGNKWDPQKFVYIKVAIDSKYLSISIKDEGNGFNTSCNDKINHKSLKSRGRGLNIIKHYCNTAWNTAGNQINISIELQ